MNAPQSYRVGVVGFGIAGGAAAALLAGAGHQVTLIERAETIGPVGAGLLLQPSGQAVLGRMGALDEVTAGAERIEALHAVQHTGRSLIYLPFAAAGDGMAAYGIRRSALFDALTRRVHNSGVTTLTARIAHQILEVGDDLWIRCEDDDPLGPYDVVVVADGARSALRDSLFGTRHSRAYPFGVAWAAGPCSTVRGELYQVTRGTRNLVGLLPLGGGQCNLFWSIDLSEIEATKARGFEQWKAEVIAVCPIAEELVASLAGFQDIVFGGYHRVSLKSWRKGSVLLIGDAAHATSPHLGQGANLALLDAEALFSCLGRSESLEADLDRYIKLRRRHTRFYSAVTHLMTPFFQGGHPVLGHLRDSSLPYLPLVPGVRRQMARIMSGVFCLSHIEHR